ncbi:MAG: DDE-type integrase/transposase/recombinase, partial [Desulfobulbaceae bacterium]|nr:DDE-type integrase/transposase/recombinase [Desulfobulbaceae bacterium]
MNCELFLFPEIGDKMSEYPKISVPVLTDENWDHWRRVIYGLLLRDDLWKVTNGTEVRPAVGAAQDTFNQFEKKQRKALGVILPTISDRLSTLYDPEPEDPTVVWQALVAHFENSSTYNVHNLEMELAQMHLDPKEEPVGWTRKRILLYDRLRAVGSTVAEQKQVTETLALLPRIEYEALVTSIMTNRRDRQADYTMRELVDLLENFWKGKKQASQMKPGTTQGAYYGESAGASGFSRGHGRSGQYQGGSSHGRGRGGARGRNPQAGSSQNPKQSKKPVKCYECGGRGHIKPDCPNYIRKQQSHHSNVAQSGQDSESSDQHAYHGFFTSSKLLNPNQIVIDSGATKHMSSQKERFVDYKELTEPQDVVLGNGDVVPAIGIGTLEINFQVGNGKRVLRLNNCLYVPDMNVTLFSVPATVEKGHEVIFRRDAACVMKDGKVILRAPLKHRAYVLNPPTVDSNVSFQAATKGSLSFEVWHQRFGHLGKKNMKKLSSGQFVENLEILDQNDDYFCEACVMGKQAQTPFKPVETPRSTELLDLIHTDICGPISVESFGRKLYFITFIDDASRYVWVYFIREKSEALKKFQEFMFSVERQMGRKIKALRSDRGGEYCSTEFKDFCTEKGIRKETTAPYSPQQNGVSERMNRTLVEKARAMLYESKLPHRFWAEAIATAVHVRNRSPTVSLSGKTPYECWFGRKPSVGHLRIFGCQAFAVIPKDHRRKLDPKAEKCLFLGYELNSKAYRLWNLDTGKVVIRIQVTFDESKIGNEIIDYGSGEKQPEVQKILEVQFDSQEELPENAPEVEVPDENVEDGEDRNQEENDQPPVLEPWVRRTTRAQAGVPPVRFPEPERMLIQAMAADTPVPEPKSWKEAMESDQAEEWFEAARREHDSLKKHRTWELVKKPPDRKIISCRWVFRAKHDEDGKVERYKARFVAKGCSQKYGVDYTETFAPVVRFE